MSEDNIIDLTSVRVRTRQRSLDKRMRKSSVSSGIPNEWGARR